MKSFAWSVVSLVLVACSSIPKGLEKQSEFKNCPSTREYVTALEFLRAQKEFSLPEDQMQKISEQVSIHCEGAARRFVRVTKLLSKSTLPSKQSVEYGLVAASLSDDQAEGFIRIFRATYSQRKLDLDPRNSIEIAKRLSFEYKGNPKRAADDFERVVEFCVSSRGIDLPKGACSEVAAKIAKLGDRFEHAGYGALWEDAYRFITAERGPGRSTAEALQVAEDILAYGPESILNFKDAYRYALSNSGLKLSNDEAFKFAVRMAKLSSVKR